MIGDEVVVVDGDRYAHSKTGSKGIVISKIKYGEVHVEFYELTGEPHELTVIFPVHENDLELLGEPKIDSRGNLV